MVIFLSRRIQYDTEVGNKSDYLKPCVCDMGTQSYSHENIECIFLSKPEPQR